MPTLPLLGLLTQLISSTVPCPTAADLDRGIVFELHGSNHTVLTGYRHIGGDLFSRQLKSPLSQEVWTSFDSQGYFDAGAIRSEKGLHQDVSFTTPLPDVTTLRLGDQFEIRYSANSGKRGDWHWTQRHSVQGTESRRIGQCDYDVLSVRVETTGIYPDGTEKTRTFTKLYVPELRFQLTNSMGRISRYDLVRVWKAANEFNMPSAPAFISDLYSPLQGPLQ